MGLFVGGGAEIISFKFEARRSNTGEPDWLA